MLNDQLDVRGQGDAVEELENVYDFVFGELNLEVVEADTSVDNVAMGDVCGKRIDIMVDEESTGKMCGMDEKLKEWRKRTVHLNKSPDELAETKEKFIEMKDKWYIVTRERHMDHRVSLE